MRWGAILARRPDLSRELSRLPRTRLLPGLACGNGCKHRSDEDTLDLQRRPASGSRQSIAKPRRTRHHRPPLAGRQARHLPPVSRSGLSRRRLCGLVMRFDSASRGIDERPCGLRSRIQRASPAASGPLSLRYSSASAAPVLRKRRSRALEAPRAVDGAPPGQSITTI